MKEVLIEIEDIELANLGVKQEKRYELFRFKESQFIGYWFSSDKDTGERMIVFYVGSQTFNCKAIKQNIYIFEEILNNK
jgi:hypothetical protein